MTRLGCGLVLVIAGAIAAVIYLARRWPSSYFTDDQWRRIEAIADEPGGGW